MDGIIFTLERKISDFFFFLFCDFQETSEAGEGGPLGRREEYRQNSFLRDNWK